MPARLRQDADSRLVQRYVSPKKKENPYIDASVRAILTINVVFYNI